MERREPVKLERDCQATEIPSGWRVALPAGSWVTPLQALGGHLTVQTERGGLARLDENDLDALGEAGRELRRQAQAEREHLSQPAEGAPRPAPGGAPAAGPAPLDPQRVWEVLHTVYDPEIPASIAELGLIYLCHVAPLPEGGHLVTIRMTLTAPGCGVGPMLIDDVRRRVAALPSVARVDVELVFDPPWDPGMMSEAAKLQLGFM